MATPCVFSHQFLNNLRTLKSGYRIEDFTVVGLLGQTSYVLIIPSRSAKKSAGVVALCPFENGALNYASLVTHQATPSRRAHSRRRPSH